MVCENSKSARVIYSFGTNAIISRNFITEKVPISLEVKEYALEIPGGQCAIPYDVTVLVGHACNGTPQTATGVYRVPNKVLGTEMLLYVPPYDGPDLGSGPTASLRVYYQGGLRGGFNDNIFGCSGGINTVRANYFARITKIVPANLAQADNCGSLKKCQLIVRNTKSNTVIFKDEGDCPCNYSVVCESCPSGTHCECDCGQYICCYDANGFPMEVITK